MSGARLFVALELPQTTRTTLARWGAACAAGDPALRAVRAGSLHLTLHFLGMRPEHELAALRDAVAACAPLVERVDGRLTQALWLAPRRPHVLTCAVEDVSGTMATLHAALGPPLTASAEGWAPERRALLPHVTVARVRRGERPRPGSEPRAPEGSFACPAVTLFRSHMEPGGVRYEALERVPAAG